MNDKQDERIMKAFYALVVSVCVFALSASACFIYSIFAGVIK